MRHTSHLNEAFWKSLPLSRHYDVEHINHAARMLSAIASADYTNPIPSPVIQLPRLLPGDSVAVRHKSVWYRGTFQARDAGYVVAVQNHRVRGDDLTDVEDAFSDTDHPEKDRVYRVRGSDLRILCETLAYREGERVMAVFPGCNTFYSASIVAKCEYSWVVRFDDNEEGDRDRAVGRLVHPRLIFKA